LDRCVAFLGIPLDDERRIRAAIGMMTVAKQVPTPWRISAVEEADLVIVAPESPASRGPSEGVVLRRGAVIAVLVGAADAPPPHCEALPWPVRAPDVRNLLLKVETHLSGGAGVSTGPTVPGASPDGSLCLSGKLLTPGAAPPAGARAAPKIGKVLLQHLRNALGRFVSR